MTISELTRANFRSIQPLSADQNGVNQNDLVGKQLDFPRILSEIIGSKQDGKVSEEELFAGLIKERITSLKGAEAAAEYQTAFETQKTSLTRPNGYIAIEEAAVNALKELVEKATISSEEGDKVYSQAFRAAQLDDNLDALYDDRGGAGDPTMAVEQMEVALLNAQGAISKIEKGELEAASRSLATASATGAAGGQTNVSGEQAAGTPEADLTDGAIFRPNGTVFDGANGFLFKPVSHNEGTLAILLRESMVGAVQKVVLKDQAGNIIEEGRVRREGISETGREKYSFSKSGGNYPKDLTVEVTMNSGHVISYIIPDPSQRYD